MKRDESRSETDFGALAGLNGLVAHAKPAQNCAISKPHSGLFFNFQIDSGGGREIRTLDPNRGKVDIYQYKTTTR